MRIEVSEEEAKHALDLPITDMDIHYEDYTLHMNNYIDKLWQKKWNNCTGKLVEESNQCSEIIDYQDI